MEGWVKLWPPNMKYPQQIPFTHTNGSLIYIEVTPETSFFSNPTRSSVTSGRLSLFIAANTGILANDVQEPPWTMIGENWQLVTGEPDQPVEFEKLPVEV